MVHCGIWDYCIVGFVRLVYWVRQCLGSKHVMIHSLEPIMTKMCGMAKHLQHTTGNYCIEVLCFLANDNVYFLLWVIIRLEIRGSRVPSQYKDSLSQYEDFHYKDNTVSWLSYVYNGNSYTGKMTSLYCHRPQVSRAWMSKYPCPRYLLLVPTSSHTNVNCVNPTRVGVYCIPWPASYACRLPGYIQHLITSMAIHSENDVINNTCVLSIIPCPWLSFFFKYWNYDINGEYCGGQEHQTHTQE